MRTNLALLAFVACLVSFLCHATPPGTAFTYQGRLNEGGNLANGSYVFRFSLDDGNNVPVGSPVTTPPLEVSNGLFTVTLDFGHGIFTGDTRRLGIEVRTNDNSSLFVALSPPQPILPAPYAIYTGSVDAAGIVGVVANSTNFSGSLAGDVTGTQGATVVSGVGGQSATNVANGASAANAATAANVAGALVKRDGNGDFSAGAVTLSGALHLPFPAIIYSGANTLLVAQGSLFLGESAGLGEVGAVANVGLGDYCLVLCIGYTCSRKKGPH